MFQIIPYGQLLWSFINESKISSQTRTWITALSLRILKKTPKITFCPLHPYIMFPSTPQNTSMKCVTPNCCFSLCQDTYNDYDKNSNTESYSYYSYSEFE